MKKIAKALLGLVLVMSSVQLMAGPRVVFVGDSITRLWTSNSQATFFDKNNFVRVGSDGKTTRNLLEVFDKDVVGQSPKVVLIGLGTNDIARNEDTFVTAEQVAANIILMAEKAKAAGIKVVLTTTMPSEGYWFCDYDVKPANIVPRLNNLLEEYAATHDCGWVDYYSMFATESGRFNDRWSYDDCHPRPGTYALMEELVMTVLEPMLNE